MDICKTYTAAASRYEAMAYPHCGRSGLRLPRVALGLWHNFGDTASRIRRPTSASASSPSARSARAS